MIELLTMQTSGGLNLQDAIATFYCIESRARQSRVGRQVV